MLHDSRWAPRAAAGILITAALYLAGSWALAILVGPLLVGINFYFVWLGSLLAFVLFSCVVGFKITFIVLVLVIGYTCLAH